MPATAEAIQQPGAAASIAEVEDRAKLMLPIWAIEAQRITDTQSAEIARGFGNWQFWREAWQALISGGRDTILLEGVFGGGRVVPMLPMADVVSTCDSVTLTWPAVFNGGHTLKEIAPSLGFGRKR